MTGHERRQEIVNTIREAGKPVSGGKLAALFRVSRQVIVQDIALLRAAGYDILSTSRGYLIQQYPRIQRIFTVRHSDEQIEEELNGIVDMGGCILDVFIEHKVYGKLRAAMNIRSRRQVEDFLESISNGTSSPLKNLTSGIHCHTVEAESEAVLDLIGEKLKEKGFYLSEGPAENRD